MANMQKLPSGNYRIRKTYRGKVYSLTVSYKPRKIFPKIVDFM